MDRDKIDKSIESELLNNGFKFYNDWEFGPMCSWSTDCEHYALKLMRHAFGYWLILSAHESGSNSEMNIGSLNNAQEIIAVRNSLSKVF